MTRKSNGPDDLNQIKADKSGQSDEKPEEKVADGCGAAEIEAEATSAADTTESTGEELTETCCRNCGADLTGLYCAKCGQHAFDINQSFGDLFREWLDYVASLDARLWKTIFYLMFRPGFLTKEYIAGRRARYLTPLKLYFASSFLLFFIAMIIGWSPNFTYSPDASDGADSTAVVQDELGAVEMADADGVVPTASQPDSLNRAGNRFTDLLRSRVRADENGFTINGQQPRNFSRRLVQDIPKAMFFLIPLFALLLKGLYRRQNLPYLQHLVFALHYHAMFYFAFSIGLPITKTPFELFDFLALMLFVSPMIYAYMALRVVYGGKKRYTFIKHFVLFNAYGFLIFIAIAATAMLKIILGT